jgi:hypothetical protein
VADVLVDQLSEVMSHRHAVGKPFPRGEVHHPSGDLDVLREDGDDSWVVCGTIAHEHRQQDLFLLAKMVDHLISPEA